MPIKNHLHHAIKKPSEELCAAFTNSPRTSRAFLDNSIKARPRLSTLCPANASRRQKTHVSHKHGKRTSMSHAG